MYTTTPSILTTLESAANQLLAAVAPNTSRLVRVAVIISDGAETASTDGMLRIRMPVAFCDMQVVDDVGVAVGLLVHEIGHFLQPLTAVNRVEAAEQIPHWLTNVMLDIQGEALMQSLFPTFKRPLAEIRRVVQRCHLSEYRADAAGASSFTEAAGALALWGRFVKPMLPFCADSLPPQTPDPLRSLRYLQTLDTLRACPVRLLPERIAEIIHEFPELRQARVPLPPIGLDGTSIGPTGALASALHREAWGQTNGMAGGGDEADIRIESLRSPPLLPEAVRLARTLRSHFASARSGVTVLAPGRFERRAAARGELPWRMQLPGQQTTAPRLVLCLDASGSMSAPAQGCDGRTKWTVAQLAAQAVALSVEWAGGQVTGLLFGDLACLTPAGDALPLTLSHEAGKGLLGNGTSFRFLVELWRRYPAHPVLVITDGSGDPPDAILSADRERTGAILIPPGDGDRAQPWSARQIVLADLRHLAAVMAMLVPRAHLA